jgi:arylsulfatase A-like enzyme
MRSAVARWLWLATAAVVLVSAVGAWVVRRFANGAHHPNVVLIVVDTLRADHLGCYGQARPTSPQLDALAASGARFADVRSASSWTAASVASIFTGLYPDVHGLRGGNTVLAGQLTTLAERFAANGYATAGFSANAAFITVEQGFAQGFGEFQVLHGPIVPADSGEDKIPLDPLWRSFAKVASADVVSGAALGWLRGRTARDPYFLYLHYFDPHAGYFPPPQYRERMGVAADAPLAGPAQWKFWMDFGLGAARDQLPTMAALYDGEIAFTDAEIGRFIAALPARASADAPLVIVTSDHGEEFAEHGGLQHGNTLYEEQLRVPLIIAGRDVPKGAVIDTPVSLVGLAATLADLTATKTAGTVPPPEPSFAALLRGGTPPPAVPIFADLHTANARHRDAVVYGRFKLIRAEQTRALYDIVADPGETRDLAADEGPGADRLAALLDERASGTAAARISPEDLPFSALRHERLKALGYAQ